MTPGRENLQVGKRAMCLNVFDFMSFFRIHFPKRSGMPDHPKCPALARYPPSSVHTRRRGHATPGGGDFRVHDGHAGAALVTVEVTR